MENSNRYKFRAWDKITEEMITPISPLHTGDYLCDKNMIVMQYTGMKDKNGKEIYFGDILQTTSDDPDTDMWEADDWGYAICKENGEELGVVFENWYPTNDEESVFNWKYIEIIGNIYEHSHLLENK